MIEIDHIIARQRRETASIALNAVAEKGDAHTAMRLQGLPQPKQEPGFVNGSAYVEYSRLGDDLDFVLS